MNVFDEEMGPLLDQEAAERLALLLDAGLTREELTAYERLVGRQGAPN